MAAQTFTVLNNGNVDLYITSIAFNTPSGIRHTANLTNFVGGTSNFTSSVYSGVTPLSTGSSITFTVDHAYVSGPVEVRSGNIVIGTNLGPTAVIATTIVVGGGGVEVPVSVLPGQGAYTAVRSNTTDGLSKIVIALTSNGTMNIDCYDGAGLHDSWINPWPSTGIGNSYWVRFTRVYAAGSGIYGSDASTGWLNLSQTRSVIISATGLQNGVSSLAAATYNVEIASDSSGSTLVASGIYSLNVTGTLRGIINPMTNVEVVDVRNGPASTYINFNRNGTRSKEESTLVTNLSNWYLNGSWGEGDNYYIRATKTNGVDPTSGVLNTWIPLSSTVSWGLTVDYGSASSRLQIEISEGPSIDEFVTSCTVLLTPTSTATLPSTLPPTPEPTLPLTLPPPPPTSPPYDRPPPTYTLSRSAASVNEGESVTITLTTTNVSDRTVVPYTITGQGITPNDLGINSLYGDFYVMSGKASVTFSIAADSITEGTEIFNLFLNTVPGVQTSVSINDTSRQLLPTYSLSRSTASVNEGQSFTITLTTTNIANGTVIPFTILSFVDVGASSAYGNFIVNNGTDSVTFTAAEDSLTEGDEVFTLSLDNVGKSISVIIIDTSKYIPNDDSPGTTVETYTGGTTTVISPDDRITEDPPPPDPTDPPTLPPTDPPTPAPSPGPTPEPTPAPTPEPTLDPEPTAPPGDGTDAGAGGGGIGDTTINSNSNWRLTDTSGDYVYDYVEQPPTPDPEPEPGDSTTWVDLNPIEVDEDGNRVPARNPDTGEDTTDVDITIIITRPAATDEEKADSDFGSGGNPEDNPPPTESDDDRNQYDSSNPDGTDTTDQISEPGEDTVDGVPGYTNTELGRIGDDPNQDVSGVDTPQNELAGVVDNIPTPDLTEGLPGVPSPDGGDVSDLGGDSFDGFDGGDFGGGSLSDGDTTLDVEDDELDAG